MEAVQIISSTTKNMREYLELNNFVVEDLADNIYKVTRESELPVFINITGQTVYFELDLGNVSDIASQDLYFKLLDLNTEILPVCFGINNTNPDDPHLVLVESRETQNLDDHELLSVFDALELATDRAEGLLSTLLEKVTK